MYFTAYSICPESLATVHCFVIATKNSVTALMKLNGRCYYMLYHLCELDCCTCIRTSHASVGSTQCHRLVYVACLIVRVSAADTPQTQPSRKKSKKQKKKQKQQQAQMAAAGHDASSDSDSEAAAAPSHAGNAAASVDGASDQQSQADVDSEDDVLERMMQATSINRTAASHEVISCVQITLVLCTFVSMSCRQHVVPAQDAQMHRQMPIMGESIMI